ncbi:MAG: hypothetical protein MUC74_01940 [Ideonella sp.]|jgi:hypothetical protein|nr:hypothetical protein [Ideonella sp.]
MTGISEPMAELCRRIPVAAWDLVLHIGAGVQPATLGLPSVQRLVLVEGDAGTRWQLALATAARPGVEVWPDVVVPETGIASWHRYNLPSLNGPAPHEGLETVYPRLQHLGAAVAHGTAVGEVLERALAAEVDDAARPADRLLVLDVPGQESALLSALPPELLGRFEWVLVRTRAPGGGDPADRGVENALGAAGFRAGTRDARSEPLWPMTLFRLHAPSHCVRQAALLAAQLQQVERAGAQALAALRDEVAAGLQERQGLERQLSDARTQLATQRDERDSARHEAEVQRLAFERERRAHEDAQTRIAALQEQARTDATALDAALAAARRAEQSARQESDMLRAALDQSRLDLDTARQRDAERPTRLEALQAELEAAGSAAEAAREQLQARSQELTTVAAERDEQRHWHRENANWVQSLKADNERLTQELEALRRQLADGDGRARLLDQEILRAEAQLDLIKDVLLREKNF